MNNEQELSWTEILHKEEVVSRLDEMALQYDILKRKYHELVKERDMYERLYDATYKRLLSEVI